MAFQPELKEIFFAFSKYQDEILDVIQDYPPDLINQSTTLMRICIEKIQNLRSLYRDKDREVRFHLQDQKSTLDSYEEEYGKPYTLTISKINTYVQTLNQQVQNHELAELKDDRSINQQKSRFVSD